MISYFYRNIKDKQLQDLKEFKVGSWIHVTDPKQDELKTLAEKYDLEIGHLTDAVDMFEVPRLEVEKSTFYIFTRFPYGQGNKIATAPILIVLSDKFVLTISPLSPEFIADFLSKVDFYTTQKIKLTLQIVYQLNKSYNYFLNRMSRQIRSLEVNLEKIKNNDIIKFVAFEGIVNDFRPTLVRTNTILRELLANKQLKLYTKDQDLVEDIMLANRQLIEIADDSLRTIVNIREAYNTIMTNNLNRVIKLLTSVTVILTIPTMISSIYGMNVELPFAHQSWAFIAIIIFMFITTGILLLSFIREEFI